MAFHIIIVDDSPAMRAFISRIVDVSGLAVGQCLEASDGLEALDLLRTHWVDIILTDINMPDINGLELISFLKNHPIYKSIPIMVISTESTAEDRKRAAALGVEEYLSKPFEAPELVDKLRRLVGVA